MVNIDNVYGLEHARKVIEASKLDYNHLHGEITEIQRIILIEEEIKRLRD